MKKTAAAETVFILLFAVVAVVAGLSQTIEYIRETPPGYVFPLVHNYVEDFYYYLHVMRQGFDGAWLATSRLSPETYPPQFVNPFFITLGHLSYWLHISLPVMYTAARAVGGFGVILATYLLVRQVFPDAFFKRVLAMSVIFTGSFFWFWQDGGPRVATLVHEWTEFDPLFRLTYIPHHLWSKAFMIGIFLCMLHALRVKDRRWIILSSALTVVMGFLSPVVLATFVPVTLLWFFFIFVFDRNTSALRFRFVLVGSVFLCALGVAVYHRIVQYSVPPWTSYIWWEKVQYSITLKTYLQTFGLNLFLFPFAIPVLWKMRTVGWLLIAWFLAGFITLFILAPFIPLTNSRYMGGYQFIPAGIGATLTILYLAKLAALKIPFLTRNALPIILVPVLTYNLTGIAASWREHRSYIEKNRWNIQVYVPGDIWAMVQYLNAVNRGGTVVAPLELNPFIPAFSNSKTISGHKTITLEYDKKNEELATFYSRSDTKWSQDFLNRYNATYIVDYTSPNADAWYNALGFSMVYNSQSLRVYKHI